MIRLRKLKRAVTVLLCAAMVVTSVPQTGIVVLAAEEGNLLEDTGSQEAALTTGDVVGQENGDDSSDETEQNGGGGNGENGTTDQGASDVPEDSGNGSDSQEDNSQSGSPEDGDTTDGDETVEDAETEENAGDDTDVPEESEEDIVLEDADSVSMNALEVMTNEAAVLVESDVPAYLGETDDDSLNIEADCVAVGGDGALTGSIAEILEYYAAQNMIFTYVTISGLDGSNGQTLTADVVNAALAVLPEEDAYLGFKYEIEEGIMAIELRCPYRFEGDVKFNYEETLIENCGVKIKLAEEDAAIPAENVLVGIYYNANKNDNVVNALGNESFFQSDRLVELSAGKPCGMLRMLTAYFSPEQNNGTAEVIYESVNKMQLSAEYLLADTIEDEAVSLGTSRQLTAGEQNGIDNVNSVVWGVLTPDMISIDSNGLLTATVWETGRGYYYVTYVAGDETYLEIHSVDITESIQIAFDEDQIDMELWNEDPERRYLRLRFYPSDAECDPGNPDEILWETSDANVVSLVKYNAQGVEDENGNPNGEIKAVGEGTATVTASYLRDTNGDGTKETVAFATCTVTVTKPLTWEDVQDDVEAMDLYALTNLDTKLSDIAIQKDGVTLENWAWQNPDTSLANFKSMDGHVFSAVYTDPETGRSLKCNLWVRMVTVTGVTIMTQNEDESEDQPEWIDWVPASLTQGDSITLARGYVIENLNGENAEEYQTIRDRMDERYSIEWTSTPKDAGTASDNIYTYTASIVGKTQKAEKKTFTVTMKDRQTNKAAFKASCNITVTVNPTYDFDLVEGPWTETDENGQMWLCLRVQMTKEEYQKQKLTVASEDKSILSLTTNKTVLEEAEEQVEGDNETVIYTYVKIPCKNPKPGTVWIKITAPDEMKTIRRDSLEFVDKEPKLLDTTAVTINKLATDRSASVVVRTHEAWQVDTENASLLLNKKATEAIAMQIEEVNTNAGQAYHDYKVTLSLTEAADTDKNLKNGKNTAGLQLTVKPQDTDADSNAEAEQYQYTVNVTMNVNSTVPKITFKQSSKVNLFYNDEEGYGVLSVDTNGAEISNLDLEDYVDKNPAKNAVCDFELVEIDGSYYIKLKEDGNAKNKKGLLTYEIAGYEGTWQTAFTVNSETKKPTIVLSATSDSLYPNIWYSDSWLTMTNKVTGECIEASEARYVVNKKKNDYVDLNIGEFKIENEQEKTITGNNSFNLLITPDGNIVSRLQGTDAENPGYSKKSDKFNLEIKEENWNDWLTVSYTLKVETSTPKLALGASTLTLNKNSEVYRGQMARTTLRLKGCSNSVMQDEWSWVSITGQDEKSKRVLKVDNSLVLQYWSDCGDITARFNNNTIAAGTYKFKVTVGNEDAGEIASSVLTVKVVDQPVNKSLKVTAKGSIDVLDREGTSISYTPKLSNLTGVIEDGWLEGRDADLFDAWMEDGKLVVHAREGEAYSTKNSYQVNAVFRVQTQDYDGYEISSAPLTIKVKQGKPKLSAAVSGILYRQLENTVDIKLSAVLNKKDVVIEDVELLNYTEDLELRSTLIQEEDENGQKYTYEAIYNPETQSVTIAVRDKYYANSILQSGKTWKVKLSVRYRDKAGNEKNAEVTCPVVVR